jgi:hypothetical protein
MQDLILCICMPSSVSSSKSTVAGTAQAGNLSEKATASTNNLRDPAKEVILDLSLDPKHFAVARKWLIVMTVSLGSFCVASASSIAALTEIAIAKEFNVTHELTILTISLFVCGLAIGPLVVGPFSEMYGRSWIYVTSFALFFVFSWPIAFAPNIGQFDRLFYVLS